MADSGSILRLDSRSTAGHNAAMFATISLPPFTNSTIHWTLPNRAR